MPSKFVVDSEDDGAGGDDEDERGDVGKNVPPGVVTLTGLDLTQTR